MNNVPLISVIIPVYNVEKYLSRCIESVLGQTYTNFEIILVDDGSTDNCPNICDEYASKDNRIKVIHKNNGGVSSARNIGILQSSGTWICFLDSDDWWDKEFLAQLINPLTDYNYDISCCGIAFEHIDKLYVMKFDDFTGPIAEVITGDYLCTESVLSTVWNKLYKLSIIRDNNLCFPENLSYAEDSIFNLQYLQKVHTICVIDKPLYHYWQESENSGVKRLHVNSDLCILRLQRELQLLYAKNNLINSQHKEYLQTFITNRWLYVIEICFNSYQSVEEKTVILNRWFSSMPQEIINKIALMQNVYSLIASAFLKKGKCTKFTVYKVLRAKKRKDFYLKLKIMIRRLIKWN